MIERFYVEGGEDQYSWAIFERLPDDSKHNEPYCRFSWLTRHQAEALLMALNDIAGYGWETRHPDWWQK